MTLIDGDRIVTAQLYNDEYEEFTEEKMSIIDYVNTYTDEGVTITDDVLDKIKSYVDHVRNTGMGKQKSLEFIDKFIEGLKAESEDEK